MLDLNALIARVTARIDEYTEDIADETPEAPIGDIPAELDHSAHAVLRAAPREAVFLVATLDKNITAVSTDISTIIPLPESYLRFLSVKIASWEKPVTTYISDDSALYQRQRYETRRGTAQKPVAAMIMHDVEDAPVRAIEAFPKGTFESLYYVPYKTAIQLPDAFTDALIWHTTSVVLEIMRYPDQSKSAYERYTVALAELSGGS